MTDQTSKTPSEYDLKIDEQVEKFVEAKQKLTYFLVTASVAIVAFLVDYAIKSSPAIECHKSLFVMACVSGLLTAGCSLLNLNLELSSYQMHLRYRYQRKSWDDLEKSEQTKWNKLNSLAALLLKVAFVFLFFEIGLSIFFFLGILA